MNSQSVQKGEAEVPVADEPPFHEIAGEVRRRLKKRGAHLTAEEHTFFSKCIEAGLYAEYLLSQGEADYGRMGDAEELEIIAAQGRESKELMIVGNIRLAWFVAGGYEHRLEHMTVEDVAQNGIPGLIRAVEKFDYAKGYMFSTYAEWWIRQSIRAAMGRENYLIEIPQDAYVLLQKVRVCRAELVSQLGRYPTAKEVSDRLDDRRLTVEKTAMFLKVLFEQPGSLQQTARKDDSLELEGLVQDRQAQAVLEAVEYAGLEEPFHELMNTLLPLERTMVEARIFYNGKQPSWRTLAADYGCNVPQAQQAFKQGLAKLERHYAQNRQGSQQG